MGQSRYTMPRIDLDAAGLTQEERAVAERIVLKDGTLRASKPRVEYVTEGRYRRPTSPSGEAAYLWRMTAFSISPIGQHQCMPVCADFDLPGDAATTRAAAKRWDAVSDKLLRTVPPAQWYGVRRWGRAMGQTA